MRGASRIWLGQRGPELLRCRDDYPETAAILDRFLREFQRLFRIWEQRRIGTRGEFFRIPSGLHLNLEDIALLLFHGFDSVLVFVCSPLWRR